MEKMNLNPQLN